MSVQAGFRSCLKALRDQSKQTTRSLMIDFEVEYFGRGEYSPMDWDSDNLTRIEVGRGRSIPIDS
uniref:Uncharacterized protein n=1 Tax=Lepeophtheirus salmonis TaxID=72036 RepID=A0A0K2T182_LEPSM